METKQTQYLLLREQKDISNVYFSMNIVKIFPDQISFLLERGAFPFHVLLFKRFTCLPPQSVA